MWKRGTGSTARTSEPVRPYNVNLPSELYERLKRYCADQGVSMRSVIVGALSDLLDADGPSTHELLHGVPEPQSR